MSLLFSALYAKVSLLFNALFPKCSYCLVLYMQVSLLLCASYAVLIMYELVVLCVEYPGSQSGAPSNFDCWRETRIRDHIRFAYSINPWTWTHSGADCLCFDCQLIKCFSPVRLLKSSLQPSQEGCGTFIAGRSADHSHPKSQIGSISAFSY